MCQYFKTNIMSLNGIIEHRVLASETWYKIAIEKFQNVGKTRCQAGQNVFKQIYYELINHLFSIRYDCNELMFFFLSRDKFDLALYFGFFCCLEKIIICYQ